MEYLLVDGYNIINSWTDVFDGNDLLENNRVKLCEMLSDYQGYTGLNIVIIFDAHLVPKGKGSLYAHDRIMCLFTKSNQTADTVIERYVAKYGHLNKVTVVTNDYMEQKTVFQKGALRMTAKELKTEIFRMKKGIPKPESAGNYVMDNIEKDQKKKLLNMKEMKNE